MHQKQSSSSLLSIITLEEKVDLLSNHIKTLTQSISDLNGNIEKMIKLHPPECPECGLRVLPKKIKDRYLEWVWNCGFHIHIVI